MVNFFSWSLHDALNRRHAQALLKLEVWCGSSGRTDKSISTKLGFTQMLCVFSVDTSNAYISI